MHIGINKIKQPRYEWLILFANKERQLPRSGITRAVERQQAGWVFFTLQLHDIWSEDLMSARLILRWFEVKYGS